MEILTEERPADLVMRRLADRCGLNVATIYSLFPSKAELLLAVIARSRYLERLPDAVAGPVDPAMPPRRRMHCWLAWMWRQAVGELPLWRPVLAEALRGDDAARAGLAGLSAGVADASGQWLSALFPELAEADRAHAGRVIGSATFAVCMEWLLLDVPVPVPAVTAAAARLDRRAADIAALIFPGDVRVVPDDRAALV